jgi:heat shock protein HtpX
MRRRRRRELFPPDRALQARMVLAAVLTPLLVVAAVAAVVVVLPRRIAIGVGIAAAFGLVRALQARREVERSRALTADEAPELYAIVERLCVLGDLPGPEIVLDDERQPNSWVIDPPGRPPRLHVTRGLLDTLEPAELEAVVAHELSHVAHRDATVMTVVGLPGAALLEGSSRAMRGFWFWQIGAFVAGAIGYVASAGTNALSRYRELSADAAACALTGRPSALASALVKVSGGLERLPASDLRAVAGRDAFHLVAVERPDRRGWRAGLGKTHPSIDERLAALERLEQRMHAARSAPLD